MIFYEGEYTEEFPFYEGHPILIFLFRENTFEIISKMLTSWQEDSNSMCVCYEYSKDIHLDSHFSAMCSCPTQSSYWRLTLKKSFSKTILKLEM